MELPLSVVRSLIPEGNEGSAGKEPGQAVDLPIHTWR